MCRNRKKPKYLEIALVARTVDDLPSSTAHAPLIAIKLHRQFQAQITKPIYLIH